MNTSAGSFWSDVGGEQLVTVHACVSTIAGFCETVLVVRSVLLVGVKLYCVPKENWFGEMSSNVTTTTWLASPWPLTSIGVPPVSGPAFV